MDIDQIAVGVMEPQPLARFPVGRFQPFDVACLQMVRDPGQPGRVRGKGDMVKFARLAGFKQDNLVVVAVVAVEGQQVVTFPHVHAEGGVKVGAGRQVRDGECHMPKR